MTTLSPQQQQAFDHLHYALPAGNVFVVYGDTGMGKTTLLREAHRTLGGAFLTMKDFVDALRPQNPLTMEETFEQLMMETLAAHDTVFFDDLHLLYNVACGCRGGAYPRAGFLEAPLTALVAYVTATGKRLIFGNEGGLPGAIRQRGYFASVEDYSADDYAFLCRAYLPASLAERLDYAKIFRFAPNLNAHQLKGACCWLARETELDTERFIDYLRSQHLASNVNLGEVQAVDLSELKGVDDVIESLEANLILPLENDALATELNLKPKRGVLLAGPPGTGKTTIGRALAHRLKSKFFLIDGTFISGTQGFYGGIMQVFEAAKQNAPSIIFIDDSDVIFESGEELGLYRYLLTMLDGLESASASRICVMMTAMDVGNLPPALIRSGRIELWLETRLPDREARLSILRQRILELPPSLGAIDAEQLADATEGLTGADIKRLVEDGKTLYAFDRARSLPLRPTTDYFLTAIETVRANKDRYAEAEARARQQHPQRPSYFDMFAGMMAAGMAEEQFSPIE